MFHPRYELHELLHDYCTTTVPIEAVGQNTHILSLNRGAVLSATPSLDLLFVH